MQRNHPVVWQIFCLSVGRGLWSMSHLAWENGRAWFIFVRRKDALIFDMLSLESADDECTFFGKLKMAVW